MGWGGGLFQGRQPLFCSSNSAIKWFCKQTQGRASRQPELTRWTEDPWGFACDLPAAGAKHPSLERSARR